MDPAINQHHVDEMIKTLKSQVKFKRGWVPYLAGYSADWTNQIPVIYLDSRLPDEIKVGKRWLKPARYLLIHELTEKAILEVTKVHYQIAHSGGTAAERTAVEADKFDWDEYSEALDPLIKVVRKPPFVGARPPIDLDRQAYIDSGELWLLQQGNGKKSKENPRLIHATFS